MYGERSCSTAICPTGSNSRIEIASEGARLADYTAALRFLPLKR
jgi:hypothetical protein